MTQIINIIIKCIKYIILKQANKAFYYTRKFEFEMLHFKDLNSVTVYGQ